ncbi:MAG: hypothetical protein AAB414_03315 [Patescibacteria group bacterium]
MVRLVIKIGLTFIAVIVLVFFGQVIFDTVYQFPKNLNYGVTFSPQYAKYLDLDWRQTFIKSLNELKVRNFRIPTYWSELEKEEGEFNFDDVDFMLDEIEKRQGKVILVVGFRQPRWPECYLPSWTRGLSLEEKRAKILNFIKATIERYENRDSIWAYQVENELFLPFFGEDCDKGDEESLKQEVDLVRGLSDKYIIISDSGELGNWIIPMQFSDVFGTTIYRDVYNSIMGYLTYPILPYLYNVKSQVIKNIFAPKNQRTIIVELQAEPWIGTSDLDKNPKKQEKHFPVSKLKGYINYAKKTGFDEVYLWGVEWWYFMAQNGHPEYLEYAKTLF